VAAGALALPQRAGADETLVGVRGGVYLDADEPFLGVEVLTRIARGWYFNPNFEYVFVDPGSLMTFNLDVHYDFPTRGQAMVWLGGGLGLVRFDPPGRGNSDTDPALNVLFGIGLRRPVIPYAQVKAIVKDDTEVSIAVGLRF
jgi:hypothetical protein